MAQIRKVIMLKPWQNTKLGIIVINENANSKLADCLISLTQENFPFETQIVVVDHQTTKNSHQELKRQFPNVRIWENRTNHSFGTSCNQGAYKVRGEYLFFINSNAIIKTGALTQMVEFLDKHYEIGVIGGNVVSPENTPLDISMRNFPKMGSLFIDNSPFKKYFQSSLSYRDFYRKHDLRDRTILVDTVACHVAFMVRHEIWKNIAPLDEKLRLSLLDIDICKKALTSNLEIAFFQPALIHYYGQDTIYQQYSSWKHLIEAENYVLQKHFPQKSHFLYKLGRRIESIFISKKFEEQVA